MNPGLTILFYFIFPFLKAPDPSLNPQQTLIKYLLDLRGPGPTGSDQSLVGCRKIRAFRFEMSLYYHRLFPMLFFFFFFGSNNEKRSWLKNPKWDMFNFKDYQSLPMSGLRDWNISQHLPAKPQLPPINLKSSPGFNKQGKVATDSYPCQDSSLCRGTM